MYCQQKIWRKYLTGPFPKCRTIFWNTFEVRKENAFGN